MLHRPTLKRHFQVHVVKDEGAVLLSERGDRVLCGPVYEGVLPLLTGRHTSAEIVDLLRSDHSPAEVYYLLAALEDHGYLTESGGEPDRAVPFWHTLDVDAAAAAARVRECTAQVVAFGDVPAEECATVLQRHGFAVGDRSDVTVVLTDDYLRPELGEFNRGALGSHQRWVLAKPRGVVVWIGPAFVPGETCCWRCLEHRLRPNRPAAAYLLDRGLGSGPGPLPPAHLPSTVDTALGMLATQLVRWIGTGTPEPLGDAITTYDTLRLESVRHALARRPQCPACGDGDRYTRQASQPVHLAERLKAFTADGGHRSLSPDETLRRYGKLVDPLTGIVDELRPFGFDGDCPTRVFASGFHAASHHRSLAVLRRGLGGRNCGKGMSDVQAKASALGESVERYSGVFQGDEPRIRATLEELGDDAIHPNRCMQFSDQQYRRRDRQNGRGPGADRVPPPFDPRAPVEWTPVWSLTAGRPKYVPTMYLYYGYPADGPDQTCPAESNGCAAGNVFEEAVLQGVLELIERDSVALWWYNRVRRPPLDREALNDALACDLAAYYRSLGREFWVLDITSDLGIPCFAAVSRRGERDPEGIVLGFGAHLDPGTAAQRAVSEMNQILASVHASEEHGVSPGPAWEWWLRHATAAEQDYLLPLEGAPVRLGGLPRMATDDLRDDVLLCRQTVEDRGMEMLVLDQTRPDISFAVARVVVPGLRHFRPRFAPGRLFDVPVELGWRAEPLREAELNPVPLFV